MKKVIQLALAGLVVLAACKKTDMQNPANVKAGQTNLSSTNGRAGVINIYYDHQLFMMNLNPYSAQAAASLLANNKSINILYESDGFITVTDAIQTDGYNPVWQEVDIVFNTGFTPHQFFRDDDIEAAASGANPEITLVPTNEVYRCDIIEKSKPQ
jgi:hypothetical protein